MRTKFFATVLMVTMMVAALAPARAQLANNTPLTFGMTTDQASQALGVQLTYVGDAPARRCISPCRTSKAARCRTGATGSIYSSAGVSSRAGKATGGASGHAAIDRAS